VTTICGTDLHVVRGKYPVKPGLVIGHEPVGVIEELGAGVTGYQVGDRVLVGAITPCGQCRARLSGHLSQCGHGGGGEALGDHRIVTTLCPGGKERMRRLLSLVQSGRFDPTPLITHRFSLDKITEGYRLFGEQSDGVFKVAIKP